MFRMMAMKHEKARYYLLQVILLMALILLFALPAIRDVLAKQIKAGISQHGEISGLNKFHRVHSRFY